MTNDTLSFSCTNFQCMLPVAMASSSCDTVAISYILQVLSMMLHSYTVRPMGQNKDDVIFL